MSHTVIPAPMRFGTGAGPGFAFRPGTAVSYADPGLAPVAGWFCSQIARRTGLRLAPRTGRPAPDEPVDTPGHAAALMRLHPELRTGRNEVEFELPPGRKRRAVWLDPELPATFELIEQVLGGVAALFPGPYLHIGGDEPWGTYPPVRCYAPHPLVSGSPLAAAREKGGVGTPGPLPLGWLCG